MSFSQSEPEQALTVALVLAALFYPLGLFCTYIILVRSSKIRCKRFVNLVVALILVSDFAYPTSRFFFWIGLEHNKNSVDFTLSTIFGGLY